MENKQGIKPEQLVAEIFSLKDAAGKSGFHRTSHALTAVLAEIEKECFSLFGIGDVLTRRLSERRGVSERYGCGVHEFTIRSCPDDSGSGAEPVKVFDAGRNADVFVSLEDGGEEYLPYIRHFLSFFDPASVKAHGVVYKPRHDVYLFTKVVDDGIQIDHRVMSDENEALSEMDIFAKGFSPKVFETLEDLKFKAG